MTATCIATKVLGEPDRGGNVSYAVKATVTNSTATPVRGKVTLQAVDADGFLLSEVTLDGLLGPSESRVFTERIRMQASDYDDIDRWQVSRSDMWDVD